MHAISLNISLIAVILISSSYGTVYRFGFCLERFLSLKC